MKNKKISRLNPWLIALAGILPFSGALIRILPAEAQFYGPPQMYNTNPSFAETIAPFLKIAVVILVPVVILIGATIIIKKRKK